MKTNKILCIFHKVDLDGWFSAAQVKMYENKFSPNSEVVLKGWTHNQKPLTEKQLLGYDKVYLVDLTLDDFTMLTLWNVYKENFVWIDHHKNSIEHIEKDVLPNITFSGLRRYDMSACGLVDQYFYGPTQDLPFYLQLLSDYDNWNCPEERDYWEQEVMPFQYYMRSTVDSPEKSITFIEQFNFTARIDDICSAVSLVYDCIDKGKLLYKYQKDVYARNLKTSYIYNLNIEGSSYRCLVLNTQDRGSCVFDAYEKLSEIDIMVVWYYSDGAGYNYSLYTRRDDINVGRIAKIIGQTNGGGHLKAAGFVSTELKFKSK